MQTSMHQDVVEYETYKQLPFEELLLARVWMLLLQDGEMVDVFGHILTLSQFLERVVHDVKYLCDEQGIYCLLWCSPFMMGTSISCWIRKDRRGKCWSHISPYLDMLFERYKLLFAVTTQEWIAKMFETKGSFTMLGIVSLVEQHKTTYMLYKG